MRMRTQRPCPTFILIYTLLCAFVNAESGDEAPPFNSPSLNPRSPDVDPTFPFVETVTTTDSLDGFIFVNTFTFTLNPSVETYTASYTGTFDLVAVTGVDVFHLTAPTPAQPLPTTLTQNITQVPQSSNQTMSPPPPPPSGKRLHAPVIAGVIVGALLALGAFVMLFHVLRRRAKRRSGLHLPLDEEMAPGPPANEKGAQVVAVPHGLAVLKGSGRGGDVGSIQAERDPSLLAEQVRVLKAQLQDALQAQDNAPNSVGIRRTAADAAAPGPSVIRPLSTTKRERERTGPLTVRNEEPVPLLVHTDSGICLEPAQAVEELPPLYVSRKSFVGQTVL
ncbi:hypothetical protein B0H13DRAFT_283408 [Mycena leptocephala]|nr:hypothetical protein B0H13DRAFT_283408 [Mycena leptocephala]